MPYRLLFFFSVISIAALGQRVRLEHADILKGGQENGVRIAKPTGNVVFKQGRTTIYCDSAILKKAENTIEAFGKIRILEGDSITITAGKLFYDGNRRVARLRKNVVFVKLKTVTLYTDNLDYYRNKNLATYFNGGKLVDTTNVLTSRKGYLNTITSVASFKKDVVGENQDMTFKSDTLQYQTKTKIVNFLAPATVTDKDGKVIQYNKGFYNTISRVSVLNDGVIETKSNLMKGDQYKSDESKMFYQAMGHVEITAKDDDMIIYGEQGDYYKSIGKTKIFGNAYVARFDDSADTLFLRADTLVSVEGKDGRTKYLLAYPKVRVFKSDLQASADSLVYHSADSLMIFYHDPVLWNSGNQMTADTIRMTIRNKNLDRIFMINNSFVASEDELENYNQIKGRKMVAHLKEDKINHVDVEGNGESLYYALETKKLESDSIQATLTVMTGMNRIICSNMKINFREGQVDNISFYVNPDAKFIPPQDLKKEETKLKGFSWRGSERPTRESVTGKKPFVIMPPEVKRPQNE